MWWQATNFGDQAASLERRPSFKVAKKLKMLMKDLRCVIRKYLGGRGENEKDYD